MCGTRRRRTHSDSDSDSGRSAWRFKLRRRHRPATPCAFASLRRRQSFPRTSSMRFNFPSFSSNLHFGLSDLTLKRHLSPIYLGGQPHQLSSRSILFRHHKNTNAHTKANSRRILIHIPILLFAVHLKMYHHPTIRVLPLTLFDRSIVSCLHTNLCFSFSIFIPFCSHLWRMCTMYTCIDEGGRNMIHMTIFIFYSWNFRIYVSDSCK